MNMKALKTKKEQMLEDLQKLFIKIYQNHETLRIDLVQEDLNRLHLEIQRTTGRMGL